jgi:Na+/melibiose symporter-like transporter
MILGIGLSRRLADRFGKRDVFGGALFVSTLFLLAFYFFHPRRSPWLRRLHAAWLLLRHHHPAAVGDDRRRRGLLEWKNHRRATAIIFSAMLCGLKIGLSVGGALVAAILAHYGYQAGLAQQLRRWWKAWLTVSVYCAIPFLLAVALLFAYEIDKRAETRIEQDLLLRRRSADASA